MRYQPALDGVRAAAVCAVLVFHGARAWLPGGFLGVDVFFVLSGYLITTLLLRERAETGRIRLGAFWGRRARRLLPALVALVAVVALAAPLVVAATELPALRLDAAAALAYVANWRMIFRGGGYFAQTGAPSLLQHTWSLGIEEQFYLLWPLALIALRGRVWIGALSGAALSSVLIFMLYDRPRRRPRPRRGPGGRAHRGSTSWATRSPGRSAPISRHTPGWRS